MYKFDVISQQESIIEASPESSNWQQEKKYMSPTLSPNEEQIVYFTNNDLYVRSANNNWWKPPQRIINEPLRSPVSYSIDWHPQKPWVIYSSSRDIRGNGYS